MQSLSLDQHTFAEFIEQVYAPYGHHERNAACHLLSAHVYTPTLSEEHKKAADVVLRCVDSIHCGPDTDYTISCFTMPGEGEGQYLLTQDAPSEPRIHIISGAKFPHLTTAHELGHHLDIFCVQRGSSGVARDPRFAAWRAAVAQSTPYQYLQYAAREGALFRREGGLLPVRFIASNEDHRHINYLKKWGELWARSYAQYVALRYYSEPIFLEWCALHSSEQNYTFQYTWEIDDTEFVPIGRAISEILTSLRWLHHEPK